MPDIIQGTLIVCPKCEETIARIAKDIYIGEPLTEDYFQGIVMEIRKGQHALCPTCGEPWILAGCLHTSDGWKPFNPQPRPKNHPPRKSG